MSEVKEAKAPETQEDSKESLYDGLKEQFGERAPNEQQVEAWKAQSGRVRFLYLNDDEVYFFRPIKRAEYKGIVESLQQAGGQDNDGFMRERLVSLCVLWPKMDPAQMADSFAGTIETLYSAIMEASNFINPEQLFTIVREL